MLKAEKGRTRSPTASTVSRLLSMAGMTLGISSPAMESAAEDVQPNIVFIMADDLGQEWVSAYGGELLDTPNIDRMAREGMRFTSAYAMPQCTPTRVTLLTGQLPFRHGWVNHWDVPRWGCGAHFDVALNTSLPAVMQSAGYRTAAAGKWQIDDFRVKPDAMAEAGFDHWAMWTGGEGGNEDISSRRYWDPYIHSRTGSRTYEGEFGPDRYAGFLLDFMRWNREYPLFIYYAMTLPHTPFTTTPDEPDAEGDVDQYMAMIRYVDKLVGQFLEAVEETEFPRPTLVVFTSDNGSTRMPGRIHGRDVVGGKMLLDEITGAAMPFIAWGPGLVPSGRVADAITDFADLLPTFAELAGAVVPGGPGREIDGRSIAPVLRGDATVSDRDWILAMGGGVATVREGRVVPSMPFAERVIRDQRWKVWVNEDREVTRLHDLHEDPFEDINLVDSSNPDVVNALERLRAVVASLPETDAAPRYHPLPPQPWDKYPGWQE